MWHVNTLNSLIITIQSGIDIVQNAKKRMTHIPHDMHDIDTDVASLQRYLIQFNNMTTDTIMITITMEREFIISEARRLLFGIERKLNKLEITNELNKLPTSMPSIETHNNVIRNEDTKNAVVNNVLNNKQEQSNCRNFGLTESDYNNVKKRLASMRETFAIINIDSNKQYYDYEWKHFNFVINLTTSKWMNKLYFISQYEVISLFSKLFASNVNEVMGPTQKQLFDDYNTFRNKYINEPCTRNSYNHNISKVISEFIIKKLEMNLTCVRKSNSYVLVDKSRHTEIYNTHEHYINAHMDDKSMVIIFAIGFEDPNIISRFVVDG